MRLHRFYIKGKSLAEKGPADRFVLDTFDSDEYAPLIHQWRDVFRYMAGGQVILFDDSKTEVLALIEVITNTRVNLVVLEIISKPEKMAVKSSSTRVRAAASTGARSDGRVKGAKKDTLKTKKVSSKGTDKNAGKSSIKSGESTPEVFLYISVLKGDNFEMVVQKTTELGVDHIVPFISERTIKKNLNLDRLQKIAIEASEQSGRRSVPKIHPILKFEQMVADKSFGTDGSGKAVNVFVCHQDGKNFTEVSKGKDVAGKSSMFIVGPEGGWSPKEEKVFEKLAGEGKLKKVSISKNVLRAETAGVLAVGLSSVV